MLPRMKFADGITKTAQVKFGGYNHTLASGDGDIYDMQNMTADNYPVLSSRPYRYLKAKLKKPNGMFAADGLCYVDGTGFYYNGELKGYVTDTKKSFAVMGRYIVIMPDKKFFQYETNEFGDIEAVYQSGEKQITFSDGTYAGEAAKGCCIKTSGKAFPFNAGDAITISGATKNPSNNKQIIIREISEDKKTLTFYENSFEVGAEDGVVTLSRLMPNLDIIYSFENRLWGAKGDTIYASKLGDIFNWNVFDLLASDSYQVDVGSTGDFTYGCAFRGYPCFFKSECVYKVYGDRPSNYQVLSSSTLGVEEGSNGAIAGETLFYLSRVGVVAYSGGIPQNISAVFGNVNYSNARFGSNGEKLWVSMEDKSGFHLFCYDTKTGLWHKEDNTSVVDFAFTDQLYMLNSFGEIWTVGIAEATDGMEKENKVLSEVIFGDFTDGSPNKKGVSKVQLRIGLASNSRVSVSISYDKGDWIPIKTVEADVKRSVYLPVIPRRTDNYRIKITGIGMWDLYSLAKEYYNGSEL